MRILITGGCGFIGSHLANFYLKQGHEVYVVDDLSTGKLDNIKTELQNTSKFHFDQASLLNWKVMDEATAWADCIYHMAAIVGIFRVIAEPIQTMETNIQGCAKLFTSIMKRKNKPKIIIPSSSLVYGFNPKKALSEDDPLIVESSNTLLTYCISKIADEALSLSYFRQYRLPVVIARIFNTIGPAQSPAYGMVVPRFIEQALNNEPITIFGNGTQTRSFCDVRDTIAMLDLLMQNEQANGQIINVGNDEEISINNLAHLIKACATSDSTLTYVSYDEAYGKDYKDVSNRKPNLTKCQLFTNYQPKWDLKQTIEDLLLIHQQA